MANPLCLIGPSRRARPWFLAGFFGAVLSFGMMADSASVRAQAPAPSSSDAARQQQLAYVRARLRAASDELAFNQAAQQRPGISPEQRVALQNRAAILTQEIAGLHAQEQALLR